MTSEHGDDVRGGEDLLNALNDVWGDDDFLNDLIQATEDASAALSSGAAASSPFPTDPSRPPPLDPSRNPMAATTTAASISSSPSWYTPFERRQPLSSLPPPPHFRADRRDPPPAPLTRDGAQAACGELDDPFAAGNLAEFAVDRGVSIRAYDFSPPRDLSQREKRAEAGSAAEEWAVGARPGGLKNAGRGCSSAGGVRSEREKDKEIERLKRELERVLKKLGTVEHEHHELQKDRSKKEKELGHAFAEIIARDAELESLKKEKLLPSKQNHSQVSMQTHCAKISAEDVQFRVSEGKGAQSLPCHVENTRNSLYSIASESDVPLRDPSSDFCLPESYAKKRKKNQSDIPSAVSESNCHIMNDDGLSTSNGCFIQSGLPLKEHFRLHAKAIGIQTEMDNCHLAIEDKSSLHEISSKLLSVWGSPTDRISGRHLISRLLVSCSTDLYVLFRFIGIPSNIDMDLLTDKRFFDVDLYDPMHSVRSSEAQKLSQLYSVMMKMRNEMAQLDDLLNILSELCVLDNVIIVHRSLHILRAVLRTICFREFCKRDNIVTKSHDNMFQGERRIRAMNISMEFQDPVNACNIDEISVTLPSGSLGLQNPWNNEYENSSSHSSLSLGCRISLFETMHKIVVRNTKANIPVEAISVMNLVLLRSDPISERGELGLITSFTSVSHILHKEVDPCTKRQAVKLLFLLLNCPKLLTIFCVGLNGNEHAESADGQDEATRLHESISTIPRGLADCIAHGGNCIQGLMLSKEAIVLLGFIASSGKSGFEILLSPISKQGNFLEMVVKVLASQMDMQGGGLGESQDLHKERAALIREALILLNRLTSNVVYSNPTLGVLTQSTIMATMTVDVASRICQKMGSYCKHDSTKKVQMEAEIVDLARLFRTRILSFLGENSS